MCRFRYSAAHCSKTVLENAAANEYVVAWQRDPSDGLLDFCFLGSSLLDSCFLDSGLLDSCLSDSGLLRVASLRVAGLRVAGLRVASLWVGVCGSQVSELRHLEL